MRMNERTNEHDRTLIAYGRHFYYDDGTPVVECK